MRELETVFSATFKKKITSCPQFAYDMNIRVCNCMEFLREFIIFRLFIKRAF